MKRKSSNLIMKIFMILSGASFLFPLFWMLNMSFKSKSEVYENPFGLPKEWVFTNYHDALERFNFPLYFKNSFIYTVGTVVLTVFLGSMLAYCLARMNWKGSKGVLTYISMGLFIPVQVVIISLYMMINTMGLKDSYFSLIIPYSAFALSSCVLMLHAFFRGLPRALEEAAALDGCNIYQCFFRIMLPTVRPALATQVVLIFMNTWNEFFLAFVMAGKEQMRTLTVGLMEFFTSIGVAHWGQIGAAMIVTSIPTVLIYCLGNKQIENALTAGAVLK